MRRMPDDELAALVRAIAQELIQLGYRPEDRPGYVQQPGRDAVRLVAPETWLAMRDILAKSAPEPAAVSPAGSSGRG